MEEKSIFYQAFVRDKGACVYCGKNMMDSFDSFAQIQLDHLKPKKSGGKDEDLLNRVISCFVCNNLKGPFDPTPEVQLSSFNREVYICNARQFVTEKRLGTIHNSLFSDYMDWLNEFNSVKS